MLNFLTRPKAGAQSQDRDGHPSSSGIASPLLESRSSNHVRKKQAHLKPPQSSNSQDMTMKEHELSQQFQEKEAESSKFRGYHTGKASRKECDLHDQIAWREVSEKENGDIPELSNVLKSKIAEEENEIEGIRGQYNTLLLAYQSEKEKGKIIQRNATAAVEKLREKLATAEQQLDLCRDDLFRLQPVCRVSDASIIRAFESLSDQLIDWIDNEASAFERANPRMQVRCLFSGSNNPDVASFLRIYPSAGEYLCRHVVNRYMIKHMFNSKIHSFGLPAEYNHMRMTIERGMAALKPPRDSQMVNIWRAETLSALAATQGYTDLSKEQAFQWTQNIFEDMSACFPCLFERKVGMERFHDQVTVSATTIVSQLQGLASAYRLDMFSEDLFNGRSITRDDLKRIIAVDLETGKTLKPGSAYVSDGGGVIGELVLSLDPSLHRVNEGATDTDLRQGTWLVRLDHGLGSRAPKGD